MKQGRSEEARNAFTAYLQYDPQDRMGAVIKLTLLGAMPQPDILPSPYIEALFDEYAPRFETALIEKLSYCVPQLLAQIVERYRPYNEKTADYILDLGCGTGLAAEVFIKRASWIEGIDISGNMIAIAANKGIYNKLVQGDILSAIQDHAAVPCHLVLAADVLVYRGELLSLFQVISNRLCQGGLFAFSTQKPAAETDKPYLLGTDHRYIHSPAYIDDCLKEAGLGLLAREEHVIRQDGGQDLTGHIILAEKPVSLERGMEKQSDYDFDKRFCAKKSFKINPLSSAKRP